MKDNKKIEAAKKLIELMQAYVNGKDIEKLVKDKYITITESDSIEFICIYNISKYRIKPKYRIKSKYRPCSNKNEFINLLLEDVENMRLVHKITGTVYYIHAIRNNTIQLANNNKYTIVTYYELFEQYEFYNRIDTVIGVKNK